MKGNLRKEGRALQYKKQWFAYTSVVGKSLELRPQNMLRNLHLSKRNASR